MSEKSNSVLSKPIETYIKEVQELSKTMPMIERIEIKRKESFGEKIRNFFKKTKK